ncbi:MAG: phenylalanine--tRNA ligase subunit alpha [Nanoarchaeota archaeon]|nr:phenylalanine--tRNA ligase subunit alpha [Nanoarchaeota archaeon]
MMEIAKKLHPLERKVLPHIVNHSSISELAKVSGLQEVEVMRACQWLENRALLTIKSEEADVIDLDINGHEYRKKGLPERIFLKAIAEKPHTMSELSKKLSGEEINICIGQLRRIGAIEIKKEAELVFSITDSGRKLLEKESEDERLLKKAFPLKLDTLTKTESLAADELLKRKQIIKKDRRIERTITLTHEGEKVAKENLDIDLIDKVTPKLLKSGDWKGKEFRAYDVEINVPRISGGKRHFTNQALEYIKSIWLELGFKEMTGHSVHTSFWDLDALFVPQDHPAREMQDTFYLKTPAKGKLPEKELVSRIKKTHEDGWTTGSLGWRGEWSSEKAKENILRTHTTVLSALTLSKLKKEDLPAKFFAVGKCYRNETMDWKHLFEFYQVEGIVVDEDANFSNLLGYLKEFFRKMGYPDVRIRPGHFPYTEPSAEVDVFHPIRKEWVELGGSGIFRPEVTKPLMGYPVPVLAWGLGLDRIIKEYWEIQDLRDSYKNDVKQLRDFKMWLK